MDSGLSHSRFQIHFKYFSKRVSVEKVYFYSMNPEILIDLVTKTMPFGKYKNRLLCDIPEYYLVWLKGKGFPEGKLGMWLSTLYEIRLNGLEDILVELKKNYPSKR